jgi:hypothetical protein
MITPLKSQRAARGAPSIDSINLRLSFTPKPCGCGQGIPVAAHTFASSFRFCSDVKRDSFGQSRRRDLLKTRAKAIEPTLGAYRDDRNVANYGAVNPFYPGVPRRYVGLR